jgi:hypothetical protein
MNRGATMKRTGLTLAVVALVVLVPGPSSFADHLKAKKAHDPAAAAKLKARLTELGMSEGDAAREVGSLTSSEVAYFVSQPDRVQVVAGLWIEEWIIGLAFGAALITAWYIVWSDTKK